MVVAGLELRPDGSPPLFRIPGAELQVVIDEQKHLERHAFVVFNGFVAGVLLRVALVGPKPDVGLLLIRKPMIET